MQTLHLFPELLAELASHLKHDGASREADDTVRHASRLKKHVHIERRRWSLISPHDEGTSVQPVHNRTYADPQNWQDRPTPRDRRYGVNAAKPGRMSEQCVALCHHDEESHQ